MPVFFYEFYLQKITNPLMVNGMTKEMELEKKEEEGLNLADYGFMFLSHWYWFVASVVVAMVIAVYYIMSTTPIYTTSTQLLIRDDKNSKGATDNSSHHFSKTPLK
jgi:tyrosine-protein kinase Etk/Wzc